MICWCKSPPGNPPLHSKDANTSDSDIRIRADPAWAGHLWWWQGTSGGGGPRGHHHVNAESDLNGEIVIVLLLNRFIARNQAMGQLSRYIVFLLTAFCQILAAMLDIARCKSRSG